MEKIMIIGAGEYQLPGIIRAVELGYYVIATDGNSKALGKKYANEFYHIDVRDIEKNLRLAKERGIKGVIGIASEVSVEAVAYISEELGLVGNNYSTALLCHDKKEYYKILQEKNINVPKTFSEYNVVEQKVFETEFVVVKPSKGSGSKLVKKLKPPEIKMYIDSYQEFLGASEEFLIQEYIDGKELTVDGFIYNGNVNILAVSEEINDPRISDNVSNKLVFPPEWQDEMLFNKIINITSQIVKSLGIEYGPIHMEYKYTPKKKLYLIDFALRGGGFYLFTHIIEKTSNQPILDKYILSAMGEDITIIPPKTFKPVIMKFLYSKFNGVIEEVSIKDIPTKIQENSIIKLLKNKGDKVNLPLNGSDRLACIIVWGNTSLESAKILAAIEKNIKFEVR